MVPRLPFLMPRELWTNSPVCHLQLHHLCGSVFHNFRSRLGGRWLINGVRLVYNNLFVSILASFLSLVISYPDICTLHEDNGEILIPNQSPKPPETSPWKSSTTPHPKGAKTISTLMSTPPATLPLQAAEQLCSGSMAELFNSETQVNRSTTELVLLHIRMLLWCLRTIGRMVR